MCVCIYIYIHTYMYIYLSICLSICLYTYLSIYLSIYLSVFLNIAHRALGAGVVRKKNSAAVELSKVGRTSVRHPAVEEKHVCRRALQRLPHL
jgi:hypothetical protein